MLPIEERNYLSKLSRVHSSAVMNVNLITAQHEKYKELQEEKTKLLHYKREVSSYLDDCSLALTGLNKVYAEFKEGRLKEVSEYITGALSVVFPDRDYEVVLEAEDPSARTRSIALSLIDSYGQVRYPFVTEGMLNNQLIAYSAAFALVRAFHYNTIFIDEAFSAAHPSNLKKTAMQIEDAVKNGMQVFLIQQAEEGYEDIPRREIYLRHTMEPASDGIEHTIVENVVDFGGCEEDDA